MSLILPTGATLPTGLHTVNNDTTGKQTILFLGVWFFHMTAACNFQMQQQVQLYKFLCRKYLFHYIQCLLLKNFSSCKRKKWGEHFEVECSANVETHLTNVLHLSPFCIYIKPFFHCDFSRRGVLAIAWSVADSELLLSCGKDAKILCSNPNTGEVSYTHHLKNKHTKKSVFRESWKEARKIDRTSY